MKIEYGCKDCGMREGNNVPRICCWRDGVLKSLLLWGLLWRDCWKPNGEVPVGVIRIVEEQDG